jgi:hypothetical protein
MKLFKHYSNKSSTSVRHVLVETLFHNSYVLPGAMIAALSIRIVVVNTFIMVVHSHR